MKEIYLDYASATPTDEDVLKEMEPFWVDIFANPKSIHSKGREAKTFIEDARKKIGTILGVQKNEIIFTSGGTESNNLALFGVVAASRKYINNPHIIISAIEHSSIINAAKNLEKHGINVSILPVNKNGIINVKDVENLLTSNTVLVSCMYVNNETGVIEPIHNIGKIIKKYKKDTGNNYPFFHTDASQAVRFLPVKPHGLGVELMTLDSQKIYGTKGFGALYVSSNVKIEPLLYGGDQENSLRSGTENVPSAIGFSKALEIATASCKKNNLHLKEIKAFFLQQLKDYNLNFYINGNVSDTIPGILSISFEKTNGENLVIALDTRGVYVSTASACLGALEDMSHVIFAMTGDKDKAKNVIRFSFGKETTKNQIKEVSKHLFEILNKWYNK